MDKRADSSNGLDVLVIKTGINVYRTFTFVGLGLALVCAVCGLVYNRDITEISITLLASFSFMLVTIFMDKIVYTLKLPTNYLIIDKNVIIYKKRKKEIVLKFDEVTYKFHPFYEDFQTVSLLVIASCDELFHIPITKKQFDLMEQYLLRNQPVE